LDPQSPNPHTDLPAHPSAAATGQQTGGGARSSKDAEPIIRAVFSPAERPDELGRLGSYRVLEVLGHGGMGLVFRAEDTELKRHIALKVMLPHVATQPRARARFRREAEAQARVEHEHIAVIYQVGEVNGVPFIAMPLLKGQTLAACLTGNSRPPLQEVVRIAREVAEGLVAAHAAGLVHRDIKPNNVWLEGPKRRVRILDFGLAQTVVDAGPDGFEPITSDGAAVGTPAFMSPEQAVGGAVDHRADLFALGVVLYQLVTGQLPFRGRTAFATMTAVTESHQAAPSVLAPEVPEPLSALIQKLLEKDPDDRPQSAEAVVAELAALEPGLSALPPNPSDFPEGTSVPRASAAPGPDWWTDTDATEADTNGSDVNHPAPAKRWPSRWTVALAAASALALVLATGALALKLYRNAQPKGVLTVETDDPDREIVIKQDGRVVRARTREREFVLPPGAYTVESAEAVAGLKGHPAHITLERDRTERVRLWVEKPALPVPVRSPDRAAAETLGPHADLALRLAGGTPITLKRGEPLPAEDFSVTGIVFDATRPLPADLGAVVLPALVELRSLTALHGWSALVLTDEQVDRLSRAPAAQTLTHLGGAFELTPDVLDALTRFPNLISLGVRAADADESALERLVREHPNLAEVLLESAGRSGKLSAKGLTVLDRLPLRLVALSGSPVVDGAFVKLLADKPGLWLVNFWNTSIGDDALVELARCKGLTTLVLVNTNVTDAGLEHLRGVMSLRRLDVRGTKVSEAGAKALSAALPLCAIEWGSGGGATEQRVRPEVERKSAETLNPHADLVVALATGKSVSVPAGDALPTEPFTITWITVPQAKRPPRFVDDVLLPAVAPLGSLRAIGVHGIGCLTLTEDQVARLATAPCAGTLVWLSADFELTPRALDALGRFPGLEALGCFATNADDTLLERLHELPRLKLLSLVQLGKEGKVMERGLTALAKLPVTDLRVTYSPAANTALCRALSGMSALRSLTLLGGPITDDDLRVLAECTQITSLNLEATGVTDAGLEHLAKMTGLAALGLKGTKVTADGVQKLARKLPGCKIEWELPPAEGK
jgi:serine/threonine protein kinase